MGRTLVVVAERAPLAARIRLPLCRHADSMDMKVWRLSIN
jgi:hypothetical protein